MRAEGVEGWELASWQATALVYILVIFSSYRLFLSAPFSLCFRNKVSHFKSPLIFSGFLLISDECIL